MIHPKNWKVRQAWGFGRSHTELNRIVSGSVRRVHLFIFSSSEHPLLHLKWFRWNFDSYQTCQLPDSNHSSLLSFQLDKHFCEGSDKDVDGQDRMLLFPQTKSSGWMLRDLFRNVSAYAEWDYCSIRTQNSVMSHTANDTSTRSSSESFISLCLCQALAYQTNICV